MLYLLGNSFLIFLLDKWVVLTHTAYRLRVNNRDLLRRRGNFDFTLFVCTTKLFFSFRNTYPLASLIWCSPLQKIFWCMGRSQFTVGTFLRAQVGHWYLRGHSNENLCCILLLESNQVASCNSLGFRTKKWADVCISLPELTMGPGSKNGALNPVSSLFESCWVDSFKPCHGQHWHVDQL